jgi:hypothetical protein
MAKDITPEQARAWLQAHAEWLRELMGQPGLWPKHLDYIAPAIERILGGQEDAFGLDRGPGASEKIEEHMARARQVFPYFLRGLSMAEALTELQKLGVEETASQSTYQRSLNKCLPQLITEEINRRLDATIQAGLLRR